MTEPPIKVKSDNNLDIIAGTLIAVLIVVFIGTFAKMMSDFNHNEHMYITAGVFISQGQMLYIDFAYLQMPYLPLIYGGLYKLLGIGSYYFLIGKLVSFFSFTLSVGIIFLLANRVLNNLTHSLSICILFLMNTSIAVPSAEASNYSMPVALSLAGFYLFYISMLEGETKPIGILASGVLVAFSIGLKLTYALTVFPYAAVILIHALQKLKSNESPMKLILRSIIPFGCGLILGFLPLLFFIGDMQLFAFNNLGFHMVNTEWRTLTEFDGPMSLSSKFIYARRILYGANNLLLIVAVVLTISIFTRSARTAMDNLKQVQLGTVLAFLLVLISIPTTLAPTPSFAQYFSIPISFGFIFLVFLNKFEDSVSQSMIRKMLIGLVVVSVAYNGPLLLKYISHIPQRMKWTGMRAHDNALGIQSALVQRGYEPNARVATLAPIYVLDAGLKTYPELTTGPFLYRVGDLLSQAERDHYVGTSPKTIGNLLENDPPTAIVTGFEQKLDRSLIEFAQTWNYEKVEVAGFRGVVYVKP